MSFDDGRAVKAAWAGWAMLLLATAAIIASGSVRSVVPAYQFGAESWMAGRPLYDGTGVGGFVYLPQSAVLFVPFALLPPVLGEGLWRLFNIGIFAFGLQRFGRFAGGRADDGLFPLLSLLSIPLVWSCARNGQATLAMAGCMLLAVVDTANARWWRASLWMALGVVVKPLILVLVLLAAVLEWQLAWRLAVALLAVALAPFLAQHPAYVAGQYAGFIANSAQAAHVGVTVQGWAHPFSALRAFGIVVPEGVQTVIRLIAAPCTLAVCLLAWKRLDKHRAAFYLYSFAAAYLLLFSPRTENNTHMLLAPAIGFFFAEAVLLTRQRADALISGTVGLAMAAARPLQQLLAPRAEPVWLSPLLAAVFTIYLVTRLFNDSRSSQEQVQKSIQRGQGR